MYLRVQGGKCPKCMIYRHFERFMSTPDFYRIWEVTDYTVNQGQYGHLFFLKNVANLDLNLQIHIFRYDNRKKRIFESHYFAVMAEDMPVSTNVRWFKSFNSYSDKGFRKD